jgi:iron complex transport system ATP-binding protein
VKKLFSPIKIENLNWKIGENRILENIDVEIEKNKFVCLVGPNGSGKTTLLKNILKIYEPEKKTVYIQNNDITKLRYKDLARRVACVPQNTVIDFNFSVLDVVLMGRTPYLKRFQSEGKRDLEIVKKCMELTNTLKLKDRDINSLSGGERQRVIIARALAQEPDILVLDEPISNLDIQHQIELLNLTKELCQKKKLTVIAVLHDLNLAMQYSDYLILLEKGRVKAKGTPEKVLTEENIKRVYNIEVCILKNPINQKPYIIPITY